MKTFIIDEWHFGAVDRGMKGTGMVSANPPYGCGEMMNESRFATTRTKACTGLNPIRSNEV
ncbi:MAG: hypothetical protein R3D88_00720 [Alphaproteobacteria bacterium]